MKISVLSGSAFLREPYFPANLGHRSLLYIRNVFVYALI